MNTEWLKLRPFNGDVKNGFEELVCQLARAERIVNKAKFVRVGVPDGGVEAYCFLENGDEYGWQAKYFTSMGDSQWQQIEKSFKAALKTHPKLKKYYISIPLDRQDPRIKKQMWFMDKWNKKVSSWERYAKAKGRNVQFEYWGNSELFDRLSKPCNEGKLHYWFNKDEFTEEWFRNRLDDAIKNLGGRYTPEINLELPIVNIFQGQSRDRYFKDQFNLRADNVFVGYKRVIETVKEKRVETLLVGLGNLISSYQQTLRTIDLVEVSAIDSKKLLDVLEECAVKNSELIAKFHEFDQIIKKEKTEKKEYVSEGNSYSTEISCLRRFRSYISEFSEFLGSYTVELSNNPFMILRGEAGVGKSHLLADIARKRLKENQFTILLLGQQFNSEEPWSQIKKQLNLSCERDTFLASINSKAEASGARILILIDAINEGDGKTLWKKYISGFISCVRRYPGLGVVFSVRSSYEKLLIPKELLEGKEIVKITHIGFANHEYEAAKIFFKSYKIAQPSIPLLHPEFSNPLFLKLFCEGLYKNKLHKIPDGYEGFSAILNHYLESINESLAEKHNYPKELPLVQKAIYSLAQKIAESGKSYLKYEDAAQYVVGLKEVSPIVEKFQFFQDFVSEGLLAINMFWDKDGNSEEGIYFTYERFGDHLIASYLVEKYLDVKEPGESFKVGGRLHEIIKDPHTAYRNKGLVDALSIQLPEKAGQELYELAPHAVKYSAIAYAFVDSIVWRKKTTFQDKNKQYINLVINKNKQLFEHFIETILLITSNPGHCFNSDFLHRNLEKYSMADRDKWWTQLIHNRYPSSTETPSPIRRILDWAWVEEDRTSILDESLRLTGQTITWFLTSTNRTLRDSATKALISLLEERIPVLIQILKTFETVNDPYVSQRVYAVAYGCALRTSQKNLLKDLGDYVFATVFEDGNVYPDILLRDYARGIIEYCVQCGHVFGFDMVKVRPPYRSELPKDFPTDKEIDAYKFDYKKEGFKDYYWSQNTIMMSMVTEYGRKTGNYGDFGRYVFDHGFRYWKDIDTNKLSNLAVKWIFERYGYDVEKHGLFDREIDKDNFDERYIKEERIGKKYQWIAFYELLARVSDNCKFDGLAYEGPWVPYVRDIDPTILIKKIPENKQKNIWGYRGRYSDWMGSNDNWIYKSTNLPKPIDLINLVDTEGVEWFVLEGYPRWQEPVKVDDEFSTPHKDIWYQVRSYIVKKNEYNRILKWAKAANFMNRWMPESVSRYELFSREYHWSPSCKTFKNEYQRGNDWAILRDNVTNENIGEVAVTAVNYLWEEGFDASKEGTISYLKPTEIISNALKLQYPKTEGELIDSKNRVICFDPSPVKPSESCLVVRKNDFTKMLKENDFEILWTVLGEKRVLGGYNRGEFNKHLEISGICYLENEKFISKLKYRKKSFAKKVK